MTVWSLLLCSCQLPVNECAEHKQVKQSAILIFTKSGARQSKLQAMFVFVSSTIHSVVWVPFASNITTAKSKKNENYFLISAWLAICYHTSEFYILGSLAFTYFLCLIHNDLSHPPPAPSFFCFPLRSQS